MRGQQIGSKARIGDDDRPADPDPASSHGIARPGLSFPQGLSNLRISFFCSDLQNLVVREQHQHLLGHDLRERQWWFRDDGGFSHLPVVSGLTADQFANSTVGFMLTCSAVAGADRGRQPLGCSNGKS